MIGMLPERFAENQLLHAYLLVCPDVLTRQAVSLKTAKSLMCRYSDKTTAEPCGKCSDCIKVESHTHPDLFETGKDGNKVSVDDIRKISDEAYLSSNEADCKVFLLHDADKYNAESQNALLKILEEPPSHIKFVLTAASVSPILPTVRSRVCTLYAPTPDYRALYDEIKKRHPDADSSLVKKMAGFCCRYDSCDIQTMDEKLFKAAFELSLAYFRGEKPDALLYFPKSREKKSDFILYLQVFLLSLHEIMYTKLDRIPTDSALDKSELAPCVSRLSQKRACLLYDALEKAILAAGGNLNLNINSVCAELYGVL